MVDDLIAAGLRNWKSADEFGLKPDEAKRYEALRKALLRYSEGLSGTDAAKEAGVCRAEFYRVLKRCLASNAKGVPAGHRALLNRQHLVNGRRNSVEKLNAKKPVAGAFQLLLKTYPKIKHLVDELILNNKHPDIEKPLKRVSPVELFTCFKRACQNVGVAAPRYPFNAANEGRSALERYRKQLLAKKELGGQAQEGFLRSLSASRGGGYYAPYAKVELDGYYLDADIEIEFAGREPGTKVRIRVKRIWIIALIEQASGSCLGYSLAFGENYAASDVLAALRHSMLPWKPLTSVSTIAYGAGDGFPSMHKELAYMCFDQLHMDNAMGQLSKMALTTIQRNYRAVPVFGPGEHPNARPHVEGTFAIWQKAGMGDWKDLKCVPYDVLRHAVDALLAAYNNSRAPGSSSTRMDSLRDMVSAGHVMNRRVPLSERDNLMRFDIVDWAEVGEDKGTPVLRWKEARYYGEGLLKVNKGDPIVLCANSQDPRMIEITCHRTGCELGSLLIERRWRVPHDLRVRTWLANDPELRRYATQGADITIALYKAISEKGASASTQRKLAVVARGVAHSNPEHEPVAEGPLVPEGVGRDHAAIASQGDAVIASAQAAKSAAGGEDGRLPATPRHVPGKPFGQDLRYIGSEFVSDLLKNIGSL